VPSLAKRTGPTVRSASGGLAWRRDGGGCALQSLGGHRRGPGVQKLV